jgi:CubicO group peptidase (beta-lactamase class C family)
MARNFLGLLILLFVSSALVLVLNLNAQKKEEPAPPKTLEELQGSIKNALDKGHVPGAGIALISHGALLWCGGVGKADVAANRDVTCETEFRVGSISKTFVALALLKLQEEGKIDLNVRLQDVAPEVPVRNPWAATKPVTIANLLEHTAGFDDMRAAEVYNLHDPYDYPLLEVFKRFREPQNVRWPPSTRMSYANPGYGIAGYLIEKVTGEAYDQYILETILRPLEMQNADFPFTKANKPLLATAYEDNPPKPIGYPYIYLRPAGDLKASPGELAKLVQFFLRRGKVGEAQLLKPESISRMEFPHTTLAAQNGLRLGYGLANYSEVEGGIVTHGHDGGIDGFVSTYRYMPEQNWGYVILLNSSSSNETLEEANRLAIQFLSKDLPKPYKPVAALPESELRTFVGYYEPRAPRNQMLAFMNELTGLIRIRVINGQLTRSGLFGAVTPLLPVGKNLFREDKDPEATSIFVTDEAGQMIFSSSGADQVSYAERIKPFWPYARLALLAICALLMVSSLLFALIWVIAMLTGKMKGVRHLSVRVLPLLAILSLLSVPLFASGLSGTTIGTFNVFTAGIFLGTVLFPLLALKGLIRAMRVPKQEIRPGVRIHSLLVALACCTVAVFLIAWGMFGVRLWAP